MHVSIRSIAGTDQKAFLAATRTSRALHDSWITAPTDPRGFKRHLARFDEVTNFGFVVYLPATDQLVGAINLTNVIHGVFRSGYLGYYAFAGFERHGYMSKGLRKLVRHAFTNLKLHRLEANIRPENLASIALVKACGFSLEGYSPAYLKIHWRDHERWAIVRGR
jgi:ribosomal-protein-alanine N-acetyltransferase